MDLSERSDIPSPACHGFRQDHAVKWVDDLDHLTVRVKNLVESVADQELWAAESGQPGEVIFHEAAMHHFNDIRVQTMLLEQPARLHRKLGQQIY